MGVGGVAAAEEIPVAVLGFGAGPVGKSSLAMRLVDDRFSDDYDATIEDTYRTQIEVDEKPTTLKLLDTAGREADISWPEVVSNSRGFLIVYSVVDRESFENVPKILAHVRREHKVQDDVLGPAIVLVGNKADLDDQRVVSMDEGAQLAKKEGLSGFYETSAKTKLNTAQAFASLVRGHRQASTVGKGGVKGAPVACCTIL